MLPLSSTRSVVKVTASATFSVVVTTAGLCATTVDLSSVTVAVVELQIGSGVESTSMEYFSVVGVIIALIVLTVSVVVLTNDSVLLARLDVILSVISVSTGCSVTNVGLTLVTLLTVVSAIEFEVELVYARLLSVVELLKASVVGLINNFSVVVVVVESRLLSMVLPVVDFGVFVVDCGVKPVFASSVVVLGLYVVVPALNLKPSPKLPPIFPLAPILPPAPAPPLKLDSKLFMKFNFRLIIFIGNWKRPPNAEDVDEEEYDVELEDEVLSVDGAGRKRCVF